MMPHLRLHVGVALLVALCACSSAVPEMTVLGVKAPQIQAYDSQAMKVFVEVHNPTRQSLNLQRIEYHLVAGSWFNSTGRVLIDRVIAAGASAVVEILVPVEGAGEAEPMHGVPYVLDARLFAIADKTKRSWKLRAKGALSNSRNGDPVLRVAEVPRR